MCTSSANFFFSTCDRREGKGEEERHSSMVLLGGTNSHSTLTYQLSLRLKPVPIAGNLK